MSDESYRVLTFEEALKYSNEPWYGSEVKSVIHAGIFLYLVPSKYIVDKKEHYASKLQELLDDFDFDAVHKCMDVLKWRWAGINGTPKKENMISVVKSLYASIEKRILDNEYCFCATGGFLLTFNPDEDHELKLVFEAVSYSTYDD